MEMLSIAILTLAAQCAWMNQAYASATVTVDTPAGAQSLTIGTTAGYSGVVKGTYSYYDVELHSVKQVMPTPIDHNEGAYFFIGPSNAMTGEAWEIDWNTTGRTAGNYIVAAELYETLDMGQTYQLRDETDVPDQVLTAP